MSAHRPVAKYPHEWMPPEWPLDLPSDEAAFVYAMRLSPQEADHARQQRRQFRSAATACRRAITHITACPTAFLALPRANGDDRLWNLLEELKTLASFFEQASCGKRGWRRDNTLLMLVRAKHREFLRANPRQKGYWKDPGGRWRGRFLEQMEATLKRLGYPYQSREALGEAITRALTTS